MKRTNIVGILFLLIILFGGMFVLYKAQQFPLDESHVENVPCDSIGCTWGRLVGGIGELGTRTCTTSLKISSPMNYSTHKKGEDVSFTSYVTNTCLTGNYGIEVSYLWNFGDGTTAAIPSATHKFTATGQKRVSVTATVRIWNRPDFATQQTVHPEHWYDIWPREHTTTLTPLPTVSPSPVPVYVIETRVKTAEITLTIVDEGSTYPDCSSPTFECGTCRDPTNGTLKEIICPTTVPCQWYYWFDDTHKVCGYSKFCGAYIYQGLKVFDTKDACEAELAKIINPSDGVITIKTNIPNATFSLANNLWGTTPSWKDVPIGPSMTYTIYAVPYGNYTIIWNTVSGYHTPYTETKAVDDTHQQVIFIGNYEATANPTKYNVSVLVGAHGEVNPSYPQNVDRGSVMSYGIFPEGGYNAYVTGCGGHLAGNTYTTAPINADCIVSATFSTTGPAATPPTIYDTDGDGVADQYDHCPTLFGSVSNHGCPSNYDDDTGAGYTPVQPVIIIDRHYEKGFLEENWAILFLIILLFVIFAFFAFMYNQRNKKRSGGTRRSQPIIMNQKNYSFKGRRKKGVK